MFKDATPIHITIVTAVCSFAISALTILLGYLLIQQGTAGDVGIQVHTPWLRVNFYSFIPGAAFAFFGFVIAWKALDTLIKK